ncbi:HI1506-related protein [Acidovorax sp. BLS4]|uniref:HI1506-related protein n=1 Tax=Acidovorax sp. BLS4 TaxID=3273430 RepID=UPI002941C506|nr:HI1506-related protein [Paracidovorax avenae]WOI46974.1 HI1506-related protein [Paracidovorax avenae]
MATKQNSTTRRGAQRAASAVSKPEGTAGKGLAVTPKVAGFRRAGYAFPDGETVIPLDELDDRQYEQLTTEPMLVTYLKDIEAAPAADAAT